jgi:U5 small nuclear ribonucleoprotein component
LGSDDSEDDFDIAPATAAPSAPGPSAAGSYAPLEGLEDEDEDMEEDTGMEMTLHGVDGELPSIGEWTNLKIGTAGNQVILHEDKTYYPTAAETYGEDVEAMVQEEDAQPLTEPIVAPIKNRRFTVQEKGLPTTRFDRK